MKILFAASYLILVATITWSCGAQLKVSSDYDKSADFKKYKTFILFNSEGLKESVSQLNHDRIINAVKNEMIRKGFIEDTASPELLVNTTAVLKDRSSVSSNNYYAYGSVYRPYAWGPGVSYSNYDVQQYKDGSLIIDIVEVESKKLIWQGIGNKEIDTPSKHPETEIPKAIESIMAEFPPGIAKK
jgi:hypothetical protein